MSIESNLESVRNRIKEAAAKAGRKEEEIRLAAVSKYSSVDDVLEAARAGQRIFAENRVQILKEKWDELDRRKALGEDIPDLEWHLIGQLQTNKVKYIVGKVSLIHSVDSFRLAKEIDRIGRERNVVTDILIEVNVSGEESKSGIKPDEVTSLLYNISTLPNVRVRGLMTMAPKGAESGELHEIFSNLCKIFVDNRSKNIYNINMSELSMGMSSDFGIAIEEGSTIVRVGHDIFLAD